MRWLRPLVFAAGCGFDVSVVSDDPQMVDAVLPACPSPPGGCIAFTCATTRSCYYYCAGMSRSTDAQTRCTMIASGGCLVTLDDTDEDTCVRTMAGPGNLIHIGLIQPSGSSEPAGGWTWRCGASTFGPKWTGSEPNDSGGEDCGTTNMDGGWVDVGCTERFRSVCEVPR